MLNSWQHISVLLMGLVLVALAACGGMSETDIDATVEDKVKLALAALPTPPPVVVEKEVPVEKIVEVVVTANLYRTT